MSDMTRRGILAAAWTVPVVTVAGTSPAYATSDKTHLPKDKCEAVVVKRKGKHRAKAKCTKPGRKPTWHGGRK